MTGTRVWITSVFLLQLLFLVGLAVYLGLCRSGDMSCIPFLPQPGRTALLHTYRELPLLHSSSVTTVLVANSQLEMWQSSSEYPDIHWKGESEQIMQRICTQQSTDVKVDLVVCTSQHATRPKLVLSSTIFFFPRQGKELIDWQTRVYPHYSSKRTLQFELFVETNNNNNNNTAAQTSELQIQEGWFYPEWPYCAESVSYTVSKVEWLPSAKVTTDNTTELQLPSFLDEKDTSWKVALYIPGRDHVTVKGSWLVENPGSFWLAVLTQDTTTSRERFVSLMDTVMARCMGIPPWHTIDIEIMHKETPPRFYTKLLRQYQIRQLYTQVSQQLQQQRQLLLDTPRTISISNDVSSLWFQAYDLLVQANDDNHHDTLERFKQAMDVLEELERNPQLSPPIDFSREHYFGIFFPLLIPLLLPNLFSWFREFKRYRESRRRKEKQD